MHQQEFNFDEKNFVADLQQQLINLRNNGNLCMHRDLLASGSFHD